MGDEPIFYAEGKAYLRVGDEDRQMSAKEIEKRILAKIIVRWDSKVSEKNVREVNEDVLKKYVDEGRKAGRITFFYTNKKAVLNKLELIKGDKLLNSGMILFSDNKNLEVQSAVFAGSKKNTFLDIKDKTGNLFDLLYFSENYIKEHINWRADLTTGTRIEVPEIPIRAISEALVNSFCHRDYTAPESNKVAVYKDRIEIWNPGDFPSEFKPLDFIKNDLPSILRNPKIAKILYYNKKIEKWGSGLKRIYDECLTNNVKVEFKVLKYGFSVVMYRKKIEVKKISELEKYNLNQRQEKVISYLCEHNKITTKEYAKFMDVSLITAKRDLLDLKNKGLINYEGSSKTGYYVLNDTVNDTVNEV